MAENQLLDTFYQMMPKSLGNGQSCNNLATDLISLLHSISPSLILCPSFSSFPLILSLCSVNQTIRGVVCLSLTTLPNWPPVPYNVMTIWEEELSGFVHMCVVQHPLQVMWAFGFVRSSEIPKKEFWLLKSISESRITPTSLVWLYASKDRKSRHTYKLSNILCTENNYFYFDFL